MWVSNNLLNTSILTIIIFWLSENFILFKFLCKIGLMHDAETSHEIKKSNGTLKTMKIKNSAAPVDREDKFA